jgi:uncharacterized protein (TIGR03067 family)
MLALRRLGRLPITVVVAIFLVVGAIASWHDMSRGEPPANTETIFRQLDASGDGVLTLDEATIATRSLMGRVFKEAGKTSGERITYSEFTNVYERLRSKSPSGAKSSTSKPGDGNSLPAGLGYLDTNGDDAISKTEWQKTAQAFSRLDTDKDSALSASELEATGGLAELLMKLGDANLDGEISRVEWGRVVHGFARFDVNGDNSLELAELERVAEAAVASASGSANLSAKSGSKSGPTRWRGNIEGRGQIELLIDGNHASGREIGRGGESLGAGTINMTGDGKTGNMDAVYTEGDRKGQTCLGMYQLDGDTLVWCVNNRGSRPQSLNASGRGNWLLRLTRVEGSL